MKAEYLTVIKSEKIKKDFVKDLENTLSPLSESGKALISKVNHMMGKGAGLKDVVIMLQSFQRGTKKHLRIYRKDIHEWTSKDGNEKFSHNSNLERAHFRWNSDTRYTLTDLEIQNISKVVGVIEGAKIVNEYTKQALDFLSATKTNLTITFKKRGAMQWDKGVERDIYRCKLKNKTGSFSFDFGQSINGSNKNELPTEYDVLTCLTKYDPESFEDFCANYGYDEDSRTAERVYKAVVKEFNNMQRLFTSDELELLTVIQ